MELIRLGLRTLIVILYFTRNCVQSDNQPEVRIFKKLGQELLQNVSSSMPWSELAFINLEAKNTLTIECEAAYPIQWNLSPSLTDIYDIGYIYRVRTTTTFKTSFNLIDPEDNRGNGNGSFSCCARCEKIGNKKTGKNLYIFAGPPALWATNSSVFDSNVLPCMTSDPRIPVQLHILDQTGQELAVNTSELSYLPTVGFRSKDSFEGEFVCRQGNFSASIIAFKNWSKLADDPNHTTLFISKYYGVVEINCTSPTSKSGFFSIGNESSIRLVNESWTGAKGKVAIEVVVDTDCVVDYCDAYVPDGGFPAYVRCLDTQDDQIGKVLYTWTIQLDSTALVTDDFVREIRCVNYDELNVTMKILECRNTLECQCFSSIPRNWDKQKYKKAGHHRYLTLETNFEIRGRTYYTKDVHFDAKDATIRYSELSGVVRCRTERETSMWTFFTSLYSIRYIDWRQAPESELVRLDDMPNVLFSRHKTTFVCEAVSFLFVEPLVFELEYKNGSRREPGPNGVVYRIGRFHSKFHQYRKYARRLIENLNFLSTLELKLPLNAIAVHCGALWPNSTDIMWTKSTFEVREPTEPYFTEAMDPNQELFVGKSQKQLTCGGAGEPEPTYSWFYEGQPALEALPELKTFTRTTSFLQFPHMPNVITAQSYTGTFECRLNNSLGNKTHKINLNLNESVGDSNNNLAITISIVSIVILSGGLVLFYILYKKYRAAKEQRDLTQQEIKDFFEGRPDLLSEFRPEHSEQTDLLPYNNEYELSADDIEFADSENKILGSGHFAIVLRAKVVSKSFPVAVKISKPNNDVTVFKSLLSEVKIMMYIGEHENLVKLVGVCTAEIRNQKIQIATEICDLGSLDNLLRKSSNDFMNLLNANQQIDGTLLTSSTGKAALSTLDLISFSAQITNGMAYLKNKNVIHGDLATRNVLLTRQKIVKISDFGLSKQLYNAANYVKKSKTPLPWRWMALESLTQMTFSSSSDVWSFGVTLYEIFSLGGAPFPNETWSNEFVERLSSGMRMGRPKYAIPEIYSKMVACWESQPENRPDFASLFEYFSNLHKLHYSEIVKHGPQRLWKDDIDDLGDDEEPKTLNTHCDVNEMAIGDDSEAYTKLYDLFELSLSYNV